MDIGIAIDRLRPGAKYRRYETYAELVNTWEDETSIPTEAELQAAYTDWLDEQAAATTLRDQIVTTAQSAVGVSITALTAAQARALLAILLYQTGAIDLSGTVRPLNEWTRLIP